MMPVRCEVKHFGVLLLAFRRSGVRKKLYMVYPTLNPKPRAQRGGKCGVYPDPWEDLKTYIDP